MPSPSRLSVLLALAVLPVAGRASAANVTVAPTRLTVRAAATSTDLQLTNRGAEPVRFSVRGYAWPAGPGAPSDLTPTDDLVVFPQIVTIAPGARRIIRAGIDGRHGAVERSYRILVTELPIVDPAAAPASGLGIRSRYNVPLFVAPALARAEATVTAARTTANAIDVTVADAGNAHVFVDRLDVRALDASGGVVAATATTGWYVLAGASSTFSVPLPPGACSRVVRVEVRTAVDGLPERTTTLAATPAC